MIRQVLLYGVTSSVIVIGLVMLWAVEKHGGAGVTDTPQDLQRESAPSANGYGATLSHVDISPAPTSSESQGGISVP